MEEVQAPDVSPVRLAFRTAYLGDRFAGSQLQAEDRTVDGEVIAACRRSELFSDPREARFLAAGRTDRGVHARWQVYAFSTPFPERAIAALPWQLPKDILLTGYAVVDPGFHPRYRALSRTYRYYFGRHDLDREAMDNAASRFAGRHDFSRFARIEDKDPVRTVLSCRVTEDHGLLCFEVTAESFLWHMVRYMASALLLVGGGKWDEGTIDRRLHGEETGPLSPAPPFGLILWEVDCGIAFEPLPGGGRSAQFVQEQGEYHAVMARICGLLP
ncbi:MAG TPA: tRNA pseudouridine(38-40) synthase TruA [Methanoregulaceae archaeon]|nr:MAG: tRNA pseudouridine(38-40) synthase TruA [Methanolinea sp.]HON81977.1 tRNA pseudouridine(38-40) synthase TruA [Methanoregulaceae archaeon]HPD10733.1 tRNA pseudouridine(38-40) synthase TruA [Methanoregulaceae archaeon]HRT15862.1 tRNA pseudouridine(38-40) synthase TruA [Methanoregulaceae archaeon]HRU31619.1 tRNA pseudouridine(38-40) synthase TruA [Methanoregulaceae archaeon]